jgi:hypothetical protein
VEAAAQTRRMIATERVETGEWRHEQSSAMALFLELADWPQVGSRNRSQCQLLALQELPENKRHRL